MRSVPLIMYCICICIWKYFCAAIYCFCFLHIPDPVLEVHIIPNVEGYLANNSFVAQMLKMSS